MAATQGTAQQAPARMIQANELERQRFLASAKMAQTNELGRQRFLKIQENDERKYAQQQQEAFKRREENDRKREKEEEEAFKRQKNDEKKFEKGEDETFKRLRDGGKSIGGAGSGGSHAGDSDSGYVILFWMALLAHIIDALTKFQRPGIIAIISYTFIALFGAFFVYKGQRPDGEERTVLTFILIAYALPWLMEIPSLVTSMNESKFSLLFSGMLILIPVLPLFLGFRFHENSAISKLSRIYLMIWLIILVCWVTVVVSPQFNIGDSTALVKNPMAGVKYVLKMGADTISKTGHSISESVQRAIAGATGQPYEGDEESKVGIYVEDVKPLESAYTLSSDVMVTAKISAVNLKEPVTVNTMCYIEGVRQGEVRPALMSVSDNYENIVDCDLGSLKEGSYEVKVRADFEFETSSDITYTFVSSSLRSDMYDTLKIDTTRELPKYTGGPVALGLPAITQPLRVNKGDTGDNVILSDYPYGVSLENKWTQGKVVRGLWYLLDVPSEVTLVDCSRDPVNEQLGNDGRNIYKFEMNANNTKETFDAVTCRMKFDNINGLLGSDMKNEKTFAARARYEYAVEGSTTILVDND